MLQPLIWPVYGRQNGPKRPFFRRSVGPRSRHLRDFSDSFTRVILGNLLVQKGKRKPRIPPIDSFASDCHHELLGRGGNPLGKEAAMSTNPQDGSRPTVVLVHGAFADASGWNGVIERLQADR